MSQQQEQLNPDPGESRPTASNVQQQQQPQSEGHGGQGLDSAMEQLRVWEQQRAGLTGRKRHGSK